MPSVFLLLLLLIFIYASLARGCICILPSVVSLFFLRRNKEYIYLLIFSHTNGNILDRVHAGVFNVSTHVTHFLVLHLHYIGGLLLKLLWSDFNVKLPAVRACKRNCREVHSA